MNKGLLSVIVLTYKNGNLLFETIKSILNQNYPHIEIIVSNDGDNCFDEDSIRSFILTHSSKNIENIIILNRQKNIGTVKSLNRAIKVCNGEYIKAIAGDDIYPGKRVFSREINALIRDKNALFAVGNIGECDSKLNKIHMIGFEPCNAEYLINSNKDKLLKYVCKKNPAVLAIQACCFRRKMFEKIGIFDEHFKLIEDLPMIIKIIRNDIRFVYINELDVLHRGGTGVSSSSFFEKNRLTYYEDLYKYFVLILTPIEKSVGVLFVHMRKRICKFRITYTKMKINNRKGKAILILKNIVPISYYCLSNFDGLAFHFFRKYR